MFTQLKLQLLAILNQDFQTMLLIKKSILYFLSKVQNNRL